MAGGCAPIAARTGLPFDRARAEQARDLGFAHTGPGASLPHGFMSKVRRGAASGPTCSAGCAGCGRECRDEGWTGWRRRGRGLPPALVSPGGPGLKLIIQDLTPFPLAFPLVVYSASYFAGAAKRPAALRNGLRRLLVLD